jgi:hypothetical protein
MKKRTKIIICAVLAFLVFSFVWFNFIFLNNNGKSFEEALMKAGEESDVVIIFNSGGWGTVPFDKAFDFSPIISETEKIIEGHNYKVSIVQYYRTEESFFAKVASLREIFFNFPDSSRVFSQRVDEFLKHNPNDKVIMAGLSNGAAFVDAAMADLKQDKNNVFAIELGAPFWKKNVKSENILSLNNQADILANGKLGELLFSAIKAPFAWAYSNLSGNHISLGQAIHINGHDYSWSQVKSELTDFIEAKL